MDIKNLNTFIKVAQLKNFSAAASELGYSQSAVSTQISNMEKELGHILFDRIGHKIALTSSGIFFLQYAQEVKILTNDLKAKLNGNTDVTGVIRVMMADSVCTSLFPSLLIDFQKKYPKIKIITKTGVISEMFTALDNNEADIICILDVRTKRPDCVILKESKVDVNFYMASNHPLAVKAQVSLSDIKKYPVYLTEENISYRKDLDRIAAEQGEFIVPTCEIGSVQVIKKLIMHSFGIGFIPDFAVKKELKEKSIVPVPGFRTTVWEQLMYHKGKALTPAMKVLIKYICK